MAYNPEEDITKKYAQSRTLLKARQDVAKEDAMQDLARSEARSGGFGGAAVKIRQKALKNIAGEFAGQEAGLGAEEAQSKLMAGEAERQRQFATGERVGSQEFSAEQNKLQMAQQADQFGKMFGLQRDEFTENQRTNLINSLTALKDAGLDEEKDWAKMFSTISYLGGQNVIPGLGGVRDRDRTVPGFGPLRYTGPVRYVGR